MGRKISTILRLKFFYLILCVLASEEQALDDDGETGEGSGTEQNQLTVPGTGFTLLEPDFKTQHSFSVTRKLLFLFYK